jgi:diguanylate cyclase (GGDEF)-like protein
LAGGARRRGGAMAVTVAVIVRNHPKYAYCLFCTNGAAVSSTQHEYPCPVAAAGIVRARHEGMAVAIGLIVIGLGFVVDVTTGRDLSLSLVYVAGVGLMVWAGSARVGLLGAVGASAAVFTDGVQNSVATGTALANAVTAFVLLLATVAAVDYHARVIREESRARFDSLTGLPNRRACEERCTVEIARLHRKAGSLSVAFLDFDGLKKVNDVRGHAAGDAALVRLANSSQALLRPTDLLSRVGGDEFVLLLPDTDYDEATTVVRRIQGRLAEADGDEPASVLAGLVTWHSAPQSIEELSSKPTPSCTAPSATAASTTSSPWSSADTGLCPRRRLEFTGRGPRAPDTSGFAVGASWAERRCSVGRRCSAARQSSPGPATRSIRRCRAPRPEPRSCPAV